MSVTFPKGYQLQASDLKIVIRNAAGVPVDPYYIRFSIFDYTTGLEVLIGVPDMIPATSGVGQYYANSTIPLDANIGDWLIRWHFNETPITPLIEVVQEFTVIDTNVQTAIAQTSKQDVMVKRLRIVLRDFNPDRNFTFRPPASEKFMQTQTQVFGYIWEDEELYEFLLFAIDDLNSSPPVTGVTLDNLPDRWRSAIITRAAAAACSSAAMTWALNSFDYNISGVSLNLQDKVASYQSMQDKFIQEWDQSRELIKRSIKIIKGLNQPRYGIGISSALGPYSRPGTQSRRNFSSGSRGGWS